MKKPEIKKLTRRQEHRVTRLTDDQIEYLDMLEEFYEISVKLNKIKEEKWEYLMQKPKIKNTL